jgi:hypothetical protein
MYFFSLHSSYISTDIADVTSFFSGGIGTRKMKNCWTSRGAGRDVTRLGSMLRSYAKLGKLQDGKLKKKKKKTRMNVL